MATIAQFVANTANAQLSTGPRTEQGKQTVSRNAVRHGLFTCIDRLHPDDRALVDICLSTFIHLYPQPEAEIWVHELALAWFRRDRTRAMEAAFLDLQLKLTSEQMGDAEVSRELLLASILMHDAVNKRILDKLHRWDRAYSRDIDRALKTLKSLPQPEPAETVPEIAKTKPIPAPSPVKPTLNGPCPCGSGRKFKRCCGAPARYSAQPSHSSQTVLS
jgi:hypothetical protein